MNVFQKKVIVSGNYIEVYEYQRKILNDYTIKQDRCQIFKDKENKKTSFALSRSRNMIRRLINCNFENTEKLKFVTLTFGHNITDIEIANIYFKKFTRNLKYYLNKDLKYIAVLEYQKDFDYHGKKKENGGRVHYHLLMNTPYIKNSILRSLWGQGFVKIVSANKVNEIRNIGAYLSKYLTKETFDSRFFGKKVFQCSVGLKRPIEIKNDKGSETVLNYYSNKELLYTKEFDSDYTGVVIYNQYKIC